MEMLNCFYPEIIFIKFKEIVKVWNYKKEQSEGIYESVTSLLSHEKYTILRTRVSLIVSKFRFHLNKVVFASVLNV